MSFLNEAQTLLGRASSKKKKLIETLDDILFSSLSNDELDVLLEFKLEASLKYYNTCLMKLEAIRDYFELYSFDYNRKFSVTNNISTIVLAKLNKYINEIKYKKETID